MAFYKFYNIQLLPVDKTVKEVGVEGYCNLFKALRIQIKEARQKKRKLSSIAVSMRGDMYFAPFSVTVKSYQVVENSLKSKIIYGSFLKFDDVNELVDTNSGELEYRSSGNTSSRRFELEFVFDPETHIMAVHDTRGLPTRRPMIDALERLLDGHAHRLFENHSLEIEELTAADSIEEFLDKPKQGYKSYAGYITFSNSDAFDEEMEAELSDFEGELKDKGVAQWQMKYDSFKSNLMSDLPRLAKVQMLLALLYGNAEVSYTNDKGEKKKYKMEDYPVREKLEKDTDGNMNRSIAIKDLIVSAKAKARKSLKILNRNKKYLTSNKD